MLKLSLLVIGLFYFLQIDYWKEIFQSDQGSPLPKIESYMISPFLYPNFISNENGDLVAYGTNWKRSVLKDKGKAWSDIEDLIKQDSLSNWVNSVLRLKDGSIGLVAEYSNWKNEDYDNNHKIHYLYYYRSSDGIFFKNPVKINSGTSQGIPYFSTLIQTKSGRLIIPVRKFNEGFSDSSKSLIFPYGKINGEEYTIETHAHKPELDASFVYYSDDNGESWSRSKNEIFIWKDDGLGGIWPFDEPNIVETIDNNFQIYGRTSLGRIFKSHSKNCVTWTIPTPTNLSTSYSPFRIEKIPLSNDLICIWNNVTTKEVKRGFRRGRLSVAISSDEGETWDNVKTIATMGLPVINRAVTNEIKMTRADKYINNLSENAQNFIHYPNLGFFKDSLVISFSDKNTGYLIFKPVTWLYQ